MSKFGEVVAGILREILDDAQAGQMFRVNLTALGKSGPAGDALAMDIVAGLVCLPQEVRLDEQGTRATLPLGETPKSKRRFVLVRATDLPDRGASAAFVTPHFAAKLRDARLDSASELHDVVLVVLIDSVLDTVRASRELTDRGEPLDAAALIDIIAANSNAPQFQQFIKAAREHLVNAAVRGRIEQRGQVMETLSQLSLESDPDIGTALPLLGPFVRDSEIKDFLAGSVAALEKRLAANREAATAVRAAREGKTDAYRALESHIREDKIKNWEGKREEDVDLKAWQRDTVKNQGPTRNRFDRYRFSRQGVLVGDPTDRHETAREIDLLVFAPDGLAVSAVFAEWTGRPPLVLESSGRVVYKGPGENAPAAWISTENRAVSLKVPPASSEWQFLDLKIFAGKATARGEPTRRIRVARAPARTPAIYLPSFEVSAQAAAIRIRPNAEFIVAESKEAHKRAARSREIPAVADARAEALLPVRVIAGPTEATTWTFVTGEQRTILPLECEQVDDVVQPENEAPFCSALHNASMENGSPPPFWKYLPQARAIEAFGKPRQLAVPVNLELSKENEIVSQGNLFPAEGPGNQVLEGKIPPYVRAVKSFAAVIDAYHALMYWLKTNETLPTLVGNQPEYVALVTDILQKALFCMEDGEADSTTQASLWRIGAVVDANHDVVATSPLWLPALAYWSQLANSKFGSGLRPDRRSFLNPSVFAPCSIRGTTNLGLRALPEASYTGFWLKWHNAQEWGDAETPRAGEILRDRLKEFVKAFPQLVGYHENAPLLVNFIGVRPTADIAAGLTEFFRWHLDRISRPDYSGTAHEIRLKMEFFLEDPTDTTPFDQRMAADQSQGLDEFGYDPVHEFVQYAKRSSVRLANDTVPYAHLTFVARGFKYVPADDDASLLLPRGRIDGLVASPTLDLPILAERKPDRIGFGTKGKRNLTEQEQFALAFNEMQAALAHGLTYATRNGSRVPCVVARPQTFAALKDIYERSLWVIHLEPGVSLIPLKYDKQHEAVLIHFTDQKNATRMGFDEVTLTKHKQAFDQCLESVCRELHVAQPKGLLALLNSVNPTWALQLFSTQTLRRTEKIACAIAASSVRTRAMEEAPDWLWLVSGWEQFHRVTGATGLVKMEGGLPGERGSDDIVMFGLNSMSPGDVRILIIEVKYGGHAGEPKGIEQVKDAWRNLEQAFEIQGAAGRMFRAELGQFMIRTAERMFVHNQLTVADLRTVARAVEPILEGDLNVVANDMDNLPRLGMVVRVDPEAAETTRRRAESGIEVVRLPWAKHAEFARHMAASEARPEHVQNPAAVPSWASGPGQVAGRINEAKEAEVVVPAKPIAEEAAVAQRLWPEQVLGAVPASPYNAPAIDKERFASVDQALHQLGVEVEVPELGDIIVGPQATAVHLKLRAGSRVPKLEQTLPTLKLALGITKDLSLSTYERPGHVTLFVPHDVRRPVPLTSLLRVDEMPGRTLPIPIGITAENKTLWIDLLQTNHLLVAGSTGSGKTVFLQGLVLSLATALNPRQLQLRMIDPKQLDFALLEGLPHSWGEIIYQAADAAALLDEMLEEIKERQAKLKAAKCQNLIEYQAIHGRESEPHIVIVIDEYNQLLGSYETKQERQAFEDKICQVAQIGRALGVYMVLATQRPSVDVVTGKIKANFPTRISFRLPSAVDSRVILDETGAEALQPGGDGLLVGLGGLRRFQAPFIDAKGIRDFLGGMGALGE